MSLALRCGIPAITPKPGNSRLMEALSRIVGGTAAIQGSWPWQIDIKAYGSHYCGGTILNEYWILTAGHCFDQYGLTTSPWTLIAGKHRKYYTDSTEQSRKASKVYRHSKYNSYSIDNDIALIKVDKAFTFNDYVQPACLPKSGAELASGDMTYVTGWGNTMGTSYSDRLKQAMVPIVGASTCKSNYPGGITSNMICAGYGSVGGVDACQGDSGGPLVKESSGKWNVYGITSWGEGCARPNKPGVYTKVSNYISWINSYIST